MRSLAAVLILASGLTAAPQQDLPPLRFTTFNVRYGTARDGDNGWAQRRGLALEVIQRQAPHVLGVQEALDFQMAAIGEALPHHRALGQDRRGGSGDEHSSLFVDERRLRIEAHGQFWLSETPEAVGSVGWDAALPRIAVWAVLEDRESGFRFLAINTHFDHRGTEARRQSARLLAEHCARAAQPVVVMGDLNAGDKTPPLQALHEAGFRDSFRLRHPTATEVGTFTDFHRVTGNRKIDHILVRGPWVATGAAIVRDQREGRFPSDHLPVSAVLVAHLGERRELVPALGGPSWALTGGLFMVRGHAIWPLPKGGFRLQAGGGALWEGQELTAGPWRRLQVEGDGEFSAPFVFRGERWHWIASGAPDGEGATPLLLADSDDGVTFRDRRTAFAEVGARDPMVLRIGETHYCYYVAGEGAPRVRARISDDLLEWSEPVDACWSGKGGATSAPFVLRREGWFYLLLGVWTGEGKGAVQRTLVYRSEDPLDFGRGDDSRLVGELDVVGAEVLGDGEFVSSTREPARGIRVSTLRWGQ